MPIKKITGRSNLSMIPQEPQAPTEKLNLTISTKKKPKLKNFLLNDLDCDRLTKLVELANRASPYKKVSEAAIVKALILLGSKMDIEKILKASRDA